MEASIFKLIYRYPVGRSARHILQGRLLDPADPARGRWLRPEVDETLRAIWQRVDDLLPGADLAALPTRGNRHNVFLAIVTTAAYQVLVERGLTREYAAELTADVGWKLYEIGLKAASLPFRLTTRDAGKRLERTINLLMKFPFSAPGRPGYEVKMWREGGDLFTHWTWCPPQAFVRDLIGRDGDHGELDAFFRSWCLYDWPGADIIAGDGARGHYRRTKTQSRGDAVCDMCWKNKA